MIKSQKIIIRYLDRKEEINTMCFPLYDVIENNVRSFIQISDYKFGAVSNYEVITGDEESYLDRRDSEIDSSEWIDILNGIKAVVGRPTGSKIVELCAGKGYLLEFLSKNYRTTNI